MYYYKKFIEEIARNGITDATGARIPITEEYLKGITEEQEPRIFVFSSKPKEWNGASSFGGKNGSHFNEMMKKEGMKVNSYEEEKLYVPFKNTWYEALWDDGKMCTVFPDLKHPEFKMYVCGVLVQEQSPGQFWYYLLLERDGHFAVITYFEGMNEIPLIGLNEATGEIVQNHPQHYDDAADCYKHTAIDCVSGLLKELRKSAGGLVSVNDKFKVKVKGENVFTKIRKIIYVVPKAQKGQPISGVHRTIDWTHRWLVRAHWRQINGLGKDRDGNYCMRGWTWVVEHEKGPSEAPLIADKVRLVK